MSDDDAAAAEELLEQSKQQERHTSEPAARDEGGEASSEQDVVGALVEELQAVEGGEKHTNVTARSASLAALLRAYKATGELEGLIDDAVAQLESDPEYDGTVAGGVKALVMVGLEETRPEAFEQLEAAGRRKESESATQL
jgi:hypothetical protein